MHASSEVETGGHPTCNAHKYIPPFSQNSLQHAGVENPDVRLEFNPL